MVKVAVKNARKSSVNSLLRKARSERGWSQQQLAAMVSSTPVNISRWENGSNFPTAYFIQKLCEVFEKTPAELGLIARSLTTSIWTVPFTRNPFFTGRDTLLELLHERLSITRMAALTQAQAIYGLGGIGKTQTAVEYAFRYGEEYSHVFWIGADSRENIEADFADLAQLLSLREKDELNQTRLVAAVKRWLTANESWLLIMDNADDLPMARTFLPTKHKGYILFTTRDHSAGTIANSIEVEKLSLKDGTELLLLWSKRIEKGMPANQALPEDRTAAKRIVEEMDGLPLAIVQAGAYVAETACSLADYLELYKTHHKELLARSSRLLTDYTNTVATTWSLSFQHIEQQSSVAADLLRLCAFLAPDAIPEELLLRAIAEAEGQAGNEAGDQFTLNEALGVLLKYSLVRREENKHMLSIHRLVQTVLKDDMDEEEQRAWAERTVQLVDSVFPEVDSDIGDKQQHFLHYYLPHVQECTELISHYHLLSPEASHLLYNAGGFLSVHGFYEQSQSFQEQALSIRKQIVGHEHPDIVKSLNALTALAALKGDHEQEEQFALQALDISEKALGLDAPETNRSRNNLSVKYRIQGKYVQAEQLLQQAMASSKRTLGNEHQDTLNYEINLAKIYSDQRKYVQAEQLLRQVLASSERVFEPEHPFIAYILHVLAENLKDQGKFELAEMFWKQSLSIFENAFGIEHPVYAEIFYGLAELYLAQSLYRKAQSSCQRALNIAMKTLGPDHPETITYREHLSKINSHIK